MQVVPAMLVGSEVGAAEATDVAMEVKAEEGAVVQALVSVVQGVQVLLRIGKGGLGSPAGAAAPATRPRISGRRWIRPKGQCKVLPSNLLQV